MKRNVLALVLFACSLLPYTSSWGQQKLPPHPWLMYSQTQIDAMRTKLTTDPVFAAWYKKTELTDVLRYLIEDDPKAALAIKEKSYKSLLKTRLQMDQDDGNAAFNWGRRMQEWIIPLEFIIDDNRYFTDQERAALADSCERIAQKFDVPGYIEVPNNNRSLDGLMGLAYSGVFLFPDNPNAARRYAYVLSRMNKMLDFSTRFDSTWREAPRYMNVAIRCFSLFAQAQVNYERLKKAADPSFKQQKLIINDKRYLAIVKNYALLASAPDDLESGHSESPAMGDAAWTSSDLNVLSSGAYQFATMDPALTKLLYVTWERGGRPMFFYGIWAPMLDLKSHQDPDYAVPSIVKKKSGFFVSRNHFNKPDESYFIVRASARGFSHVHNDAGAFSLFSRRTPLMVHPGVAAYTDREGMAWVRSTQAQNLVVFKNDAGEPMNGLQNGDNIYKENLLSKEMDFVKLDITPLDKKFADKYYRSMAVLKDPVEMYVVYDYVESAYKTTNNLHYLTKTPEITNTTGIPRAICSNKTGMTMQTDFLLPEANISFEKTVGKIDRVPRSWGSTQQWIKVNAEAGQSHLTVLTPMATGSKGVTVDKWPQTNAHCKAFVLTGADGTKYMVIANLTDAAQQVTIQNNLQLRDLFTNITYTSTGATAVNVPVRASSVAVYRMEAAAVSLPVEFISFEAAAKNDVVNLTWTVIPNQDNDHFTVQRSANGIDQWDNLATIAPQPIQGSEQRYAYTDRQPMSGKNYYRIMQTDANGQSIYSVIRTASIGRPVTAIKILGNPVRGVLHLQMPADNKAYLIQVTDASGRVVQQQRFGANAGIIGMNLQSVANGVYFVHASNGQSEQTEQIIVAN
ncbi:MAG TPA: heparinase II/III family protein [Chitinophagaceae bacterium]|nr:heparinase II/III family protein [Chitinophagaceae bacterium]